MKKYWPLILAAVAIAVILFTYFRTPNQLGNALNFILAVFTYAYVILTWQMIRKMVEAQEKDLRPWIILEVEHSYKALYERFPHSGETRYSLNVFLVVRNTGRMAAENLQITFDPETYTPLDTPFSQAARFEAFPPGKTEKIPYSLEKTKNDFKPVTAQLTYSWAGNPTPHRESQKLQFGEAY